VSEFVEECRREWRRLGVPDPVANEMAADLTADLEEAEAEGGSPEDVLGLSAFDPRRFAASWAAARGVTGSVVPDHRTFWRPSLAIACATLLGALVVGAALVLGVGRSSAVAFTTRRIVGGSTPIHLIAPGAQRLALPGPLGQFTVMHMASASLDPLAWLVLIAGIVGLGVLAVMRWPLWPASRRSERQESRRTRNWN
jgi:hypothetical protein